MRRYKLAVEDDLAREVEQLATEYDLTEREVLRQLVERGMESID